MKYGRGSAELRVKSAELVELRVQNAELRKIFAEAKINLIEF